ncbi:hypothetical protein GQ55_8G071700 [Panicum hallii var. hallii]|uniref:Uncharacterized protein n=1 Tax=Panicum hallii var. hallii TaxID=1504633 RepID=A0A2T7CLK5_9POAL|nr:hypothetical protein GQ55_8G071700 [Panicum hallii var. hallii]
MRCVSCFSKFEILGPKVPKTSVVGLQNMDGDQRYWSRLGGSGAAAVTSTHSSDGETGRSYPPEMPFDTKTCVVPLTGTRAASRQHPFPCVSQHGNIPAVYGHTDSSQTSKTEICQKIEMFF